MDEAQVIVDLGAKRDGIVPSRDLNSLDDAYRSDLHVGDVVPVSVLSVSDRQDAVIVSLRQGLAQRDWLRAERLLESEEVCEAEVTEANRGGVIVRFGRLRGFVPNSHLRSVRRGLRGEQLAEAKSALSGRTLSLAVIEVEQKRRRLVLSERVAARRQAQQLLEELVPGEVRTGVVSNIVPYGAFVDLGGVDGLIHISEMDWKHVSHPSEVLNAGDEVQVYVLKVDQERKRIGLSRKRLLPDPWHIVTENLIEGEVVEGTVTSLVAFGMFVDVGEGIEGLVHTSQMPDDGDTLVDLAPGSAVKVRVLSIDSWRRRISLSVYQTAREGPPAEPLD
jgi:small subunit ribosomal protein S1